MAWNVNKNPLSLKMTLPFLTPPFYPLASSLLAFSMLWFLRFLLFSHCSWILSVALLNHSETSWYPSWKTQGGSAHFVSSRFVWSAAGKRVSCVHQITLARLTWLAETLQCGQSLVPLYVPKGRSVFFFFLLCKALWELYRCNLLPSYLSSFVCFVLTRVLGKAQECGQLMSTDLFNRSTWELQRRMAVRFLHQVTSAGPVMAIGVHLIPKGKPYTGWTEHRLVLCCMSGVCFFIAGLLTLK